MLSERKNKIRRISSMPYIPSSSILFHCFQNLSKAPIPLLLFQGSIPCFHLYSSVTVSRIHSMVPFPAQLPMFQRSIPRFHPIPQSLFLGSIPYFHLTFTVPVFRIRPKLLPDFHCHCYKDPFHGSFPSATDNVSKVDSMSFWSTSRMA